MSTKCPAAPEHDVSLALFLSIGANSLADPPSASVLLPAAGWVQGTLMGTLASIVAIIAVALVGFAMLSGRVDVRRGVTILIGCFILFGASTIASGLRSTGDAMSGEGAYEDSFAQQSVIAPTPLPVAPQNPSYFDPYAGASVPQR